MNLVIVESPTKARKLTGYLGKDFKIEASVGHVRDLPSKSLAVDVEKNFEPQYEISDGKNKVVTELKREAKKANTIYLAMDPDREGEAIAWHIKHILETARGGKKLKFERATFNEITKKAVLKAIENPGELNMDMVDAQQARRVVDRLVGYKLSPVLWKKIRRGLSAGRVQSVALRLIVEREREIEAFKPEEYWELDVLLGSQAGIKLSEELKKEYAWLKDIPQDTMVARVIKLGQKKYEPKSESDVKDVVSFLKKSKYAVDDIERKERKRASLPPFTTSTLQQAAATRLGFTSKQTMTLAQQLYEEGLITYHRTDAVNLSTQAVEMARGHISQNYGQNYLPAKARLFKGKSKNAQEAHEAIRVTHIETTQIDTSKPKLEARHQKLYDLIWRRFVASQMESAIYDQTTILIKASGNKVGEVEQAQLKATGSVLKFDGWMKLFPGQGDRFLPAVDQGQDLHFADLSAAQKFTQPPARYNDASVIKELEKRGIGRPSTYASIISVIVDRGYVERQQKRFFATSVGMTVCDFLIKYFKDVMDYDFTAEMEEDLDRISRGEKEWRKVVGEFYKPFEKQLEKVTDKAERMQVPVEKTGEKCPDCLALQKKGELKDKEGNPAEVGEIVIRTGRFGKFKSCSRYPECKFTENIVTVVEGVKCPLCGEGDVVSKNTRWGKPFFGCGNYPKCDWASWKQPEPGEKITKAEWAEKQRIRKERAEARKKKWEERNGGKKAKSGAKSKKGTKKKTATEKKTTKAKK